MARLALEMEAKVWKTFCPDDDDDDDGTDCASFLIRCACSNKKENFCRFDF